MAGNVFDVAAVHNKAKSLDRSFDHHDGSKGERGSSAMISWLKECEICNAGLCSTVDTLIKEERMGLREASRELARQAEEHFKKEGAPIEDSFSADAILSRYRWHTNRIKKRVCDNHTEDPTDITVTGENSGFE